MGILSRSAFRTMLWRSCSLEDRKARNVPFIPMAWACVKHRKSAPRMPRMAPVWGAFRAIRWSCGKNSCSSVVCQLNPRAEVLAAYPRAWSVPVDWGLRSGRFSWSGERVALVGGPVLGGVDGVPPFGPIHALRVAGIPGVWGGRVARVWMVVWIRVGRMLGIWVVRSVDWTLRLGGAGVGVRRVEDHWRRLHGGDVVLLKTRLTGVNTQSWGSFEKVRKEPLTSSGRAM